MLKQPPPPPPHTQPKEEKKDKKKEKDLSLGQLRMSHMEDFNYRGEEGRGAMK